MRCFSRWVIFLTVLSLIGAAGEADWDLEKIDGNQRGFENAILVDSNGNFYVSTYNIQQTALEFIYTDNSTDNPDPHFEIIDNDGDTGRYLSMTSMNPEYPVISYYDVTHGDLKVAYRIHDGWTILTVDSEGDVGKYTSIAMNSCGEASISYFDVKHTALKYAYSNAAGWFTEFVAETGDTGYFTSLAMDSTDLPHIAYRQDSPPELKHSWKSGGEWHHETVFEGVCRGISLALDDEDHPHISFFDPEHLYYAVRDDEGWHVEEMLYGLPNSDHTSLKLDNNGYPCISFPGPWHYGTIGFVYKNQNGWHYEIVDDSGTIGAFSSLVLNYLQRPWIAYFDEVNKQLKIADRFGNSWNTRTITEDHDIGEYLCLRRDSRGLAHVSFYDATDKSLRYICQDSTGWAMETVDREGTVGWYTSMALDVNDLPHISYYDYDNGDLKYAYKDTDGWHITAVDTDGIVGFDTSIRLDADGYPHITYYEAVNETRGHLKYAWMDSDGWHIQRLDPGDANDIGRFSSLWLDENGFEHISCQDDINNALKYFYRDSNGWHSETVENQGGAFTSLALDSSGTPCISHYDWIHTALKYSRGAETGWETITVDNSGDVGSLTSLALDGMDHPHITYFDYRNHALKYAFFDGLQWFFESLPCEGDCRSSIVVDDNNVPYICFSSSGSIYYGIRQGVPFCDQLGVRLWMPDDYFEPGDTCACSVYLCNPDETPLLNIPLFVILDIYGELYFAPSFSDFDYYDVSLFEGIEEQVVLPPFLWPDDGGNADGIIWYAGLTTPEMDALLGEMDMWTFGWGE